MIQQETIEIQLDADTKLLAERASAALGYASLTAFITSLILDNAPTILQHETSIQLTNTQFDDFIAICNNAEHKASTCIVDAARRMDKDIN